MELNEAIPSSWNIITRYFENQGFSAEEFSIESEGHGQTIGEALSSLTRSAEGSVRFEGDITLEVTYNTSQSEGSVRDVEQSNYNEVKRYADDLSELLNGDITYED